MARSSEFMAAYRDACSSFGSDFYESVWEAGGLTARSSEFMAAYRDACLAGADTSLIDAIAAMDEVRRLLQRRSEFLDLLDSLDSLDRAGGSGSSSLAGDGFSPALDPAEEDSLEGGAA
ncbi:MAG: hypothetical protein KIC38_01705 [Actinomycetaceae bacterium]|nr:hypothetical protein [Actinomycetaceae bacterium]